MTKRVVTVSLAFLFLVALAACAELGLGAVDDEAELLKPPSVSEVIRDAADLQIGAVTLLERREAAAARDLTELYEERMDDARNDRAVERLESQLKRALSRLEKNYDERRDRLELRLTREAESG